MTFETQIMVAITILFIFSSLFQSITMSKSYCYMDDKNPYQRFASRTLYNVVRGSDTENQSKIECDPVYMWSFFRHGIRYTDPINPDSLNYLRNQILFNHKQNRGSLCVEDLEALKLWKYSGIGKAKDDLAPVGYYVEAELGKRVKQNFKHLLSDEKKLEFFCTLQNRTCQTARAFLSSFEESGKTVIRNDTLRFLELDRNWIVNAFREPENQKENLLFLETEIVMQLRAEISERLGFNETLPYNSILDMYEMCSFDQAWYPDTKTGFCVVFLHSQLKILEFQKDLQSYYKLGYGSQFNIRVSNPIFEDFIFKMINASKGRNHYYQGTFYFSHSTILIQTLVKLGLYRDAKPVTHNSFNRSDDMQWSTAIMTPFSANLISVLYKCNGTDKIILYHNERIIKFPGCDKDGLCSLEFYLDKYQQYQYLINSESVSAAAILKYQIMLPTAVLFIIQMFLRFTSATKL